MIRLLLLLLASSAFAATTPQYWVHTAPGIKQGALFVNAANHASWYSEWLSVGDGGAEWLSPTTGKSSGVEHWIDRNGFLMIDYFASGFDFQSKTLGYQRIPANCIKATLQDVPTGQTFDLVCDGHGHYYSPVLLPRDAWRVYIWGDVGYKFLWIAEFTPVASATNPCYYSGEQTLPAIVQKEIWWDALNGWVEGSGSAAFDALGNPIMPMFSWGVQTTVMFGEGVALNQNLVTGSAMCLYSRWTWG